MKALLKVAMVVGLVLIAVSLGGRAVNAMEATKLTVEQFEFDEAQARIAENREKSDRYKWLGLAGATLVLGARLGQRLGEKGSLCRFR